MHLQWGEQVLDTLPILQVFLLTKPVVVCNFYHRYTSTVRDDTSEKQNIIFGTETFVCNYRDHTFPVVLDQVCTHCSRNFGPLLHTDLLQKVSLGNKDF